MKSKLRSKSVILAVFLAIIVPIMFFAACDEGGGDKRGGPDELITEPGTPLDDPRIQSIGVLGDSFTSEDGFLQVTVPPLAVTGDTEFAITPVTNPATNGVRTYKLEPENVTFLLPVTLTFSASEEDVKRTSLEGMGVASRNDDGSWEWLEVVRNTGAMTLSVQVNHFCDESMLEGVQLSPLAATVNVNETQELQIMTSLQAEDNNDPLAPLEFKPQVYKLTPIVEMQWDIQNWSVNSAVGGGGDFGNVNGNGISGTFIAPGNRPDPETVTVSVEVNDLGASGMVKVCSQITIIEESSYSGTFTVSATHMGLATSWTGTGEATWTPTGNGEYTVSGTVTPNGYEFGGLTCTLQGAQSFTRDGFIDYMDEPPTVFWSMAMMTWSANCEGTIVSNFLILDWSSDCGGDWVELDDSVYPEHLNSSFKFPCGSSEPAPSTTVTWDFAEQP